MYIFTTNSIAFILGCVSLLAPVLYITGVVFYQLFIIVCWRFRRVQRVHSEESLPDRLIHAEAYPPP